MMNLFDFLSEEKTMEVYMIISSLMLLFGVVALSVGFSPVLFFIGVAMNVLPLMVAAVAYVVCTIRETL